MNGKKIFETGKQNDMQALEKVYEFFLIKYAIFW